MAKYYEIYEGPGPDQTRELSEAEVAELLRNSEPARVKLMVEAYQARGLTEAEARIAAGAELIVLQDVARGRGEDSKPIDGNLSDSVFANFDLGKFST